MKVAWVLVGALLLGACSTGAPADDGEGAGAPTTPTTAAESTTSSTDASTTTSSTVATTTTEPASDIPDLSGVWDAQLRGQTRPQDGTVIISQVGSVFSLVFEVGFECAPAAACAFDGVVEPIEDDGAVVGYSWCASNGGSADEEGGTYTSSFCIQQSVDLETGAPVDDSFEGAGHSKYEHPDGTMEWDTYVILTRRGSS